MLGNCEKMVLISSPSNQWTQQNNQQIDVQRGGGMGSVAAAPLPPPPPPSQKVATFSQQQQQQNQQQQQQQQQGGGNNSHQEAMRCPRCDSSNTKFCYYNNYSLSQPRHFCKACKRYWTRGGTLRNVPVGGGCRKNKRVKRPHLQTNSSASNNSSSSINNNNNNINHLNNLHHETSVNSGSVGGHIHDLISSASNPLFYGLPTTTNHNHNLMNFPFSRYDLQNPSQINALGLGFSSGLVHNGDLRNGLSMNLHNNNNNNSNNNNNNNGNNTNNKQIFQDFISSNNPLLSNYANTTSTTTTSSATTTPTISSLLASNFHMKGNGNNFQTLLPSYEEGLHMKGNGQGGMFGKEVKMELEGQNRSLDHHWSAPSQNQMDHSNNMGSSSSDPSVIWGSGPNLGAWLDSSNNNHHHNLGSSVPSLI